MRTSRCCVSCVTGTNRLMSAAAAASNDVAENIAYLTKCYNNTLKEGYFRVQFVCAHGAKLLPQRVADERKRVGRCADIQPHAALRDDVNRVHYVTLLEHGLASSVALDCDLGHKPCTKL